MKQSARMQQVEQLDVLNFSGGKQSLWLLWMVLLGRISLPKNFVVINANPGMENKTSLAYVKWMFGLCRAMRIECITAEGPNLYEDILAVGRGERTRLDNPPFWTIGRKGKMGQLLQGCTTQYKIRPINRVIRRVLHERFGSPMPPAIPRGVRVCSWIGFASDESHRIKPRKNTPKFIELRFPLVEMGITKNDCELGFREIGIKPPPRSVCEGCFAHGLKSLKEMHDTRPDGWAKAVAVDRIARNLSSIGVQETGYISSTLVPIEELAARNFDLGDEIKNDIHQCNTGHCFI